VKGIIHVLKEGDDEGGYARGTEKGQQSHSPNMRKKGGAIKGVVHTDDKSMHLESYMSEGEE